MNANGTVTPAGLGATLVQVAYQGLLAFLPGHGRAVNDTTVRYLALYNNQVQLSAMNQDELHLSRAPIVEAVIALDVTPLPEEYMATLQEACAGLGAEYPLSEPTKQVQFKFEVTKESPSSASITQEDPNFGIKLLSQDKRRLLQFNRTGFIFSRLAPYDRWESFRDEAMRLWEKYRGAIGSIPVTGFGLRYVNRLFIPLNRPIDSFLRLYPYIPDTKQGLPRIMKTSFMRCELLLDEPQGTVIVQEATLPPEKEDSATVALDFDLRFLGESRSDQQIWQVFEMARHAKNRLFAESLTGDFLETFK